MRTSSYTGRIICVMICSFIHIQTVISQGPAREIIFNNTTFAIFTRAINTDNHISWQNARIVCRNWGGDLATIKSKQEDTLFYYLTNINSYFASWIGLNDRGMGNEAGTDPDGFRWEDGSDSTYRQFATAPEEEAYPRATSNNYDCVSFRYSRGQGLSNGWHDRPCGATVFSYFCQRPGISNGCDLIYENFCYQIFTASDGISWYDAQSTCSVWGGDLTSVPSERVNNFLYTIVPDTTSKYWIGLYDDNGDESFDWIDGTQVSYTNYASSAPNDFNSGSCNAMETDGEWNNYDCGDDINNYICRRDSNSVAVYGLLRELTYDESTFAIFTTFPKISWTAAQDDCISWGGNLATIKSEQEDTLLYYLTDINPYFASWIGLNDRTDEADTNSDQFVWVDGSDSNYRQFATSPEAEAYPLAETEESDCVSFRYNRLNGVSDGWHDRNCDAAVFSYYCQKSDIPNGCDLTYEGSCYRVFDDGISWYDAQSTCTVWGGDLTSVPSERVNNFLYTIVPDTTSKYWIGLYDDNGDESFDWIDGTQVSYTNYVSSAPNNFNSGSCVAMETDGEWNNYDCGDMNDYICKRDSTDITALDVTRNLTYDESTFAIFTTFPKISWTAAQDDCISWGGNLATIKSEQEDTLLYYLTDIDPYFASWIGLNDRTDEADTNSDQFVWVDGSDSNYRQFATSPEAEAYPLAETEESDCVSFRYNRLNGVSDGWHDRNCDAAVFSYYCQKSATSNGCDLIYEEKCYRAFEHNVGINWSGAQDICTIWGGDLTSVPSERVNNFLYTIVPDTTSKYWIGLYDDNGDESFDWIDGTQVSYTNYVSSAPNDFNSGSCVAMETDGEWNNVNCANTQNNFICRRSQNYITGYTTDNFISTSTEGRIQNGSVFFSTEDTITISCTVSNPIYGVEWYYRSLIDNIEIEKTSLSIFSTDTGISSLNISSNQLGYYSCIINTDSVYSVNVVNSSSLISITSLDNPSQQIDYTVGSATSMLYYSVPDISDSSLRWTADTIANGDTQEYSNEYTNPVDLSRVFSDVGAGVQTLSCFYRMSPVTLLGSLQMAIRDTATLTISYEGYSNTFSDVNNPIFPSPERITIRSDTENITFICSQCLMIQFISQTMLTNITILPYNISVLSEDNEGNYMLVRETPSGAQYITARVYIEVAIPTVPSTTNNISNIAETPQAIENSLLVVFIVAPIVVIVAIVLLGIIVTFFIWLILYKKRDSKMFHQNDEEDRRRSIIGRKRMEDDGVNNDTIAGLDEGYMVLGDLLRRETTPESQPHEDINQQSFTETITYEEASEVVDPRMLPIPLDIFKTHMNKLWQRETLLEEEYESLGGKEHRYPCVTARTEQNKTKNRFKLIYPYDKHRVILQNTGHNATDYINASHIPGVYVKQNFIAAQGPKENTLKSFWQMIIENQVVNIVMLTNLVESGRRKCETYFPVKIGSTLVIGPYDLTLEKEDIFTGYAIKIMKVHFPGGTACIKHFHFTAWPDHDVPILYDELLLFVANVQEGLVETKAPILVHCSAGVGRTGTFLTLYNLLSAIQQTKPISIYRIVQEMREYRPQMVQTCAQYKFIYLSVLEILLGSTSIRTQEFINTYRLYMQSENEGYVSVFYQQFSELNYQCEKGFIPVCKQALLEINQNKNPVKHVLPSDSNRVGLSSPHWEGDYINATALDFGEIIITIHPTSDTLRDFHQLIYQMDPSLVVMLSSPLKLRQIELGKSDRIVYWPTLGKPLQAEPFVLTCVNSEKSSFIRNSINLHHTIDDCSRSFTQIIAANWNEKEEPNLESTIILIQTILEFRKHSQNAPIIIHCEDGAGKSCVLYTVYKAIRDSREKRVIDIFHTVKKLRSERMNTMTNLTHFVSCFSLMNEYCSRVK